MKWILSNYGMNEYVCAMFARMMYGPHFRDRKKSVVAGLHRALKGTNVKNLKALMDAYLGRKTIKREELNRLVHTPSFIIQSSQSPAPMPFFPWPQSEATTLDLLGCFSRRDSSWIKLRGSGHLATVERPGDLSE